MPHIHLEATSNLPECESASNVLDALCSQLASCETISAASIKAYFTKREVWSMGEGSTPGYVHCQVSILTGRPVELRQRIARELAKVVSDLFSDSISNGLAKVTLELREMDSETYVK